MQVILCLIHWLTDKNSDHLKHAKSYLGKPKVKRWLGCLYRLKSKFDPNNKAVVKLEKQIFTAQVVLPPQSHIGRPVTKPDVVN